MNNVMAIDLETKNLSTDFGGWGNTHMFLVSTVTTWNGNTGTVYVDEPVSDTFSKSGIQTKIRRRANGKFLVKYRQDPTLVEEKKKNGKKDRKSRKRDTDKRKFEIDETSI